MKYLQAIAAIIISICFIGIALTGMKQSDCNHAYEMVQLIDSHSDKYHSHEAYLKARKIHADFWIEECTK